MLADDLLTLREAGASLLVGLVHPDGAPHACRAHGLEVIGTDPVRVRTLIATDALADVGRSPGSEPFPIAVTVAALSLFRAVQIKGTAEDLAPPTQQELDSARRSNDIIFDRLVEANGADRTALAASVPADQVAVTVVVTEAYDQTPGPGAGRAVETA